MAGTALALGVGILIGRLYWLQVVKYDEYRMEAAIQQLKDVTITPTRGEIYDANGSVLAKSSIVWTYCGGPKQIKAPTAAEGDTRTKPPDGWNGCAP